MALARAWPLLGELSHVLQAAFLSHDLQHAGKPLRLSPLHHQLTFPVGIEQVVMSFRQGAHSDESRVIAGHVSIVINRRPKSLLLELFAIKRISLWRVTHQYAAAVQ